MVCTKKRAVLKYLLKSFFFCPFWNDHEWIVVSENIITGIESKMNNGNVSSIPEFLFRKTGPAENSLDIVMRRKSIDDSAQNSITHVLTFASERVTHSTFRCGNFRKRERVRLSELHANKELLRLEYREKMPYNASPRDFDFSKPLFFSPRNFLLFFSIDLLNDTIFFFLQVSCFA